MEKDEIHEAVIALLARESGRNPGTISTEQNITRDLGLDSLEATQLIMSFEEEFSIEIPDKVAEIFTFGTIGDIIKQVKRIKNETPHSKL